MISNEAETENAERVQSVQEAVDEASAIFTDHEIKFTVGKASIFNTSFKISPYLFAIVAGPFGYFERQTAGMPLMRIYARQTLVKDIRHEEIFTATECGITFY